MSQERQVATRYRERAEGLRSIADQDERQEIKRLLMKSAEDYERMAREIESFESKLQSKRASVLKT
jgi:hypothetical protein